MGVSWRHYENSLLKLVFGHPEKYEGQFFSSPPIIP
jgi:hypothetical protein